MQGPWPEWRTSYSLSCTSRMCYRKFQCTIRDPIYCIYNLAFDVPSRHLAIFLLFDGVKIPVGFAKHPDRKRELEVRIRYRTIFIKHPFNRLLWPRSILCHSQTPELAPKPILTGSCLDMTNLTARSIGPGSGYPAYIRAIVAQHVCTIWVFLCSTHFASSHV